MTTVLDNPREDWLGICVEDDDTVWFITPDGESYYPDSRQAGLFNALVKAHFPLQLNGDALMVDLSIKPRRLPIADVTAYTSGAAPREHPMGEAGIVVAAWLRDNPGMLDDVLAHEVPDEY